MTTSIKDLIQQLKDSTGIKRDRTKILNEYENGRRCFIALANAMLAWKNETYDPTKLEKAIKSLICWAYLLDDEEIKLDFTKGILLKGKTGRGKSFLMKVFAKFLKIDNLHYTSNGKDYPLSLSIVNAKNIALFFQNEGITGIAKFTEIPCLCIDDIGAEMDESSHYGNRTSVIDWILDQRESKNLITFGTTNFNRLSEKYDDRIVSRINSLFNVISISHETDFRINTNKK